MPKGIYIRSGKLKKTLRSNITKIGKFYKGNKTVKEYKKVQI